MSTNLKEWLQQTIAELEEERDATPGAVNEDAAMALEAMKIALASLEAEPAQEWTNEQCLEFLSIAFRHAEIKGDLQPDDIRLGVKMVSGSRAAMLQGAEPVSNRDELPEGGVACSERMPERDVDVQVYCADKKEQMVGYIERNEQDGYFRFASLPNGGGVYCQPTHWMPLPSPPAK